MSWKSSSKSFKTAVGGLIMIFGMVLLSEHLIFRGQDVHGHVSDWIAFLIFSFGASILLPFEFAIIVKSARGLWRPGDPDRRSPPEE